MALGKLLAVCVEPERRGLVAAVERQHPRCTDQVVRPYGTKIYTSCSIRMVEVTAVGLQLSRSRAPPIRSPRAETPRFAPEPLPLGSVRVLLAPSRALLPSSFARSFFACAISAPSCQPAIECTWFSTSRGISIS